jgi:pimeloyl-ACP methyl ester carboxylesterase
MSNSLQPTILLVHGAWADGSSWGRVIGRLHRYAIPVIAAPIPLTSMAEDVAVLDRTIDRAGGPVILVGHAYAGAVIGASNHEQIRALVYVAALAPDEGETVADVFYREPPHTAAPELAPDSDGYIWLPAEAIPCGLRSTWRRRRPGGAGRRPASHLGHLYRAAGADARLATATDLVPAGRRRPDDQSTQPSIHGRSDGGTSARSPGRPRTITHRTGHGLRHHRRGA